MKNDSLKAVLFDWDGTLVDSLPVWLDAFDVAFRQQGLELTRTELVAALGDWHVAEKHGITNKDALMNSFEQEGLRRMADVVFFPDVLDMLHVLKESEYKVGVVSSSVRSILDPILDSFALHEHFDVVVTGEMTTEHKPDPEPILLALEKLGVLADEAVMIGDSMKDVQAAENAGSHAVRFMPQANVDLYSVLNEKETGFEVVTGVGELRKLLGI